MTILVRADGSTAIGLGHIMRCLALAQAAKDQGHAVIFLTAPGNPLNDRLQKEGCEIIALASAPGSSEDAKETVRYAREKNAEWIVIDGYHFRSTYQASIKESGLSLLFIDDYGHGSPYSADLLLNQNSYAAFHEEWYAKRPTGSRLLLGCSHTFLQRDFRTAQRKNDVPKTVSSVLVTLGGGDPRNATLTVVEALKSLPVEVTVVLGKANPHLPDITAAAPMMKIIVDSEEMPMLMQKADLAVAAGGTTSYELAYMGVPSLLLVLAENQRRVAEDLAKRDVAIALMDDAINEASITREFTTLLSDHERRKRMSANGQALVDGNGADRVLRAMQRSS